MHDPLWLAVGLFAQLLFFGRFLVQWLTSEREGRSTIPPLFWYFSLAGGILLLAYSIEKRDPVFILGQSLGLLVYVRNLMLLGKRGESDLARIGPWVALSALALLLALAFVGTRGLWEPDEGRYAECAREMVVSGNYLTPTLGWQPHLTKPPLTYWLIAGSISAFGRSEAAVRLPTALFFAATVMLVAMLGSALWDRRTGILAAIVHATFLTTYAAGNFVTPDTPLALWEGLALLAFWRGFVAREPWECRLWPAVTGAAFGFAMLTKGPPGLLFLPAMVLFRAMPAGRRPGAAPVLSIPGALLFLAIGCSWYVASVLKDPKLVSYFLGEEVLGRVLGHHHRNQQWYGAIVIYGPTLLVGTLPWCWTWPGIARRWIGTLRGETVLGALSRRPRALFLSLVFLVPLAVMTVSRSRLPLYLLPLFIPLALATARGLAAAADVTGQRLVWGIVPPAWARALPVWIVVLLAARAVFAVLPSSHDARRLYRLLPHGSGAELVLGYPESRYGVGFYYARDAGDRAAVEYAWWPSPTHRSEGEPLLEEIAEESRTADHRHLFVVADPGSARLTSLLTAEGAAIDQTVRLPGGLAVLTGKRPGFGPHAGSP